MEEILMVISCILSMLISAIVGKRYAEKLVEPLGSLGIVTGIASTIALLISFLGFIGIYAWTTSTTVSTAEQLAQHIFDSVQALLVFVWSWLLNALASTPSGLVAYIVTYLVASLRE